MIIFLVLFIFISQMIVYIIGLKPLTIIMKIIIMV